MTRWEQALCVVAALLLVAPGIVSGLLGVAMVLPMIWRHLRRGGPRGPPALARP